MSALPSRRSRERRSFFEHCALADYDADATRSARRPSSTTAASRAHAIDASSKEALVALIRETRADAVLNSVDPLFNVPIFDACFEAGVTYLDMAMTLSEPHPTNPYEETGVKLGDYQFERAAAWEEKGLLALVGIGIEPGAADVFARYAADELFSEIDEVGDPRRREPRRRGLRLRADLLDLDDDRGVPQPARRSGRRTAAGSRPRRSPSRRSSTSPRGSARSSA